ncbi:hypothetical protein AB0M28_05790 [Streptomyces sp. NPDC051940]|uniref:hypothetical protein n=1 Tax=Streptomyces sp. NPDC051940 TaxID=3155675 RepID=UPI00341D1086
MTELEWVPEACTLPSAERPLRVAEWDALFAERLRRVSRPEALRLRLSLEDGAGVMERVSDLAERESGCCSFFTFTVTTADDVIDLDIAVDPVHEPVLSALADRARALTAGEDRS